MPITLLIADECEVMRAGLKSMVADASIKIVAETSTGKEAVRLTLKHKPDVALLGVRMPDGDGLNALSRIVLNRPNQRVLMFSQFDSLAHAARAVTLGASGWILSTTTREQLLAAIHTAATGESTWTRQELQRLGRALSIPRQMADADILLTLREVDVLSGIARGLTNREIAQTMSLSYETIKETVQRIFRKVGVVDRTQVAVWAVRKGLV